MSEVETLLKENRTDEAIIKALGKVCEKLPFGARDLCKQCVAQYLCQLIDVLLKKQPPEVVCKELGLRPKKVAENDEDSEQRAEIRVRYARRSLRRRRRLSKITLRRGSRRHLILCDVLHPFSRRSARSLFAVCVGMLLKKLPADVICKNLGLCKKPSEGAAVSCSLCKLVIGEVEKLLKENRTEEAIIKAPDKVCDTLPEPEQCKKFVGSYLPKPIELLLKKQPPVVVYKELTI
jgi:hypothetical protein